MAIFDTLDTRKKYSTAVNTTGTAPNYEVSFDLAPSAYYEGMTFSFQAIGSVTSIGATMNVNGLGAKTILIKRSITVYRSVYVYEISSGGWYTVSYDASADAFVLHNPTIGYYPNVYTPSVGSPSGTLTLNATGNDNWWQWIAPDLVRVHLQCHLNLSGSSASYVQVSLPFSMASHDQYTFGGAAVEVASGYSQRLVSCFLFANDIRFYRNDLTNWAIDSSFYVYCTMIYNPII